MRSVVVPVVATALLLAGCGGGDTPSAAVSSTSAAAAASSSGASASASEFGPGASGSASAATSGGTRASSSGGAAATPKASVPTPSAGSKGLTTSAWTTVANQACADYAKQQPPAVPGSTAAIMQSRIRDRAWSITGRLRGLPRSTGQAEAFVTLLYSVGQQSDWLIQQYLDPKADKSAVAAAKAKRDAQLNAWYAQARQLGTGNCASVMRSA